MRTIIVSFSFLAIGAVAIIGSMYIFEVRNGQQAMELLLKTEGVILLLGACSAAVYFLLAGGKKKSQD